MNGEKFLSKVDALSHKNRLLVIALFVMLAFNVMNWGSLMAAQSRTQVVVVPIGGEGMQIGNGKADPRYIRRMARYVVNQIGTYSAGSARLQFQELLDLFPPEKVTGVAQFFDKLAADVERYPSIASNVVWAGTDPLKFTSKVIQVQTIKEQLVNGNVTGRKQVFYCLDYRIDDARFFLVNIVEKEDAGLDLCLLNNPAAPGDAPQSVPVEPAAAESAAAPAAAQ